RSAGHPMPHCVPQTVAAGASAGKAATSNARPRATFMGRDTSMRIQLSFPERPPLRPHRGAPGVKFVPLDLSGRDRSPMKGHALSRAETRHRDETAAARELEFLGEEVEEGVASFA